MKIDLRQAAWFGRERAIGYARMLAIGFVFPAVWFYLQALGTTGSDFLAFWSASDFLLKDAPAAAYDVAAQQAFQTALGRDHYFPFLNPPPFLFLIFPLAWAPYQISLVAWVAATYALWLSLARRLIAGSTWPVAVFPGAMVAAWHAQNGFVTASLFIGACLAMAKRPALAGVLIGALVIKPHLAILAPIAFIAGREWRAFAGAAGSALGLLAAAYLVFGPDVFLGFASSVSTSTSLLDVAKNTTLLRMPTLYGTLAFYVGGQVAMAVQIIAALIMAGVVWWTWARTKDSLARFAVLALATPLATPYLYHYDLVLLILPVCWLAREGMRLGFRPWEKVALVILYWSPFLARAFSEHIRFNPMPIVLVAMLILAIGRVRAQPHAREGSVSAQPAS